MKQVFVIMGVSGSGKTTVGKVFSAASGLPFYDADDFHPQSNIRKMSAGQPLDDNDRAPWLNILAENISSWAKNDGAVLACSALKEQYREILSGGADQVNFVYLKASEELIRSRFRERSGHFMPDSLIRSQFDTLEEPKSAITIDAEQDLESIVNSLMSYINTENVERTGRCQIGLIGLGVMGTSLARNLASRGTRVAIFNPPIPGEENRTSEVVGRYPETKFQPAESYRELVENLEDQAVVFLMVKAGEPVDSVTRELLPYLKKDDIIIDGGNSHFDDTNRRVTELEAIGIQFVGMGVSGGEEGALKGPAMMPGGNSKAKEHILSLFAPAAARTPEGEPCIDWMGEGGSGHFVKMIHNGIEYAEMQLIAELYHILKSVYGQTNDQQSLFFEELNQDDVQSYLLDITVDILKHKNDSQQYTIDTILAVGGQKGTGRWTVDAAMRYGVAVPSLTAAVEARTVSSEWYENSTTEPMVETTEKLLNKKDKYRLKQAFVATKVIIYRQGLRLIEQASQVNNWHISITSVLNNWRAGCIIRSNMLQKFIDAFEDTNSVNVAYNILFEKYVSENQRSLRKVTSKALKNNLPAPVLTSSLNYLLTLSSPFLPMNMIQAQRDYFGAHTYEKIDKPRGEFFHTDWDKSA